MCILCRKVQPKRADRAAFKHKHGFVILEELVIGVCDTRGNRYYAADTLKRVQAVASWQVASGRVEGVPVARDDRAER